MRGVHECGNHAEAEILKSYLAGFGIDATYDGIDSIGFTGRYRAMRGVTLKVPEAHLEEARRLIDEADFSAEAEEEDGEAGDDWRDIYARERAGQPAEIEEEHVCPNCGSVNVHLEGPPRWFNWLLLGLPGLFSHDTLACVECGWCWRP
jgi:hypothetical protein